MAIKHFAYLTVRRVVRARCVGQHRAEADVHPIVVPGRRGVVAVVALVDGAAVEALEVLRGRGRGLRAPSVVVGHHLVGVEVAQVHAVRDLAPGADVAQDEERGPKMPHSFLQCSLVPFGAADIDFFPSTFHDPKQQLSKDVWRKLWRNRGSRFARIRRTRVRMQS